VKRLPFQLPDFTRLAWANSAAEAHWKPRLSASQDLIPKLQIESVIEGYRACALQPLEEPGYALTATDITNRGLAHSVLYRVCAGEAYSNEVVQGATGRQMVMVAIGEAAAVNAIVTAHTIRDDHEIGRLLGYPPCCVEFFVRRWKTDRFIDTTWPMAANSTAGQRARSYLRATPPPETNLLLKCVGVRPVFHLPCSFECSHSLTIAGKLRELAARCGLRDSAEASRELLSLPARWTSLHGIAEIETPVFRVSTKTDAVAQRLTIEVGDPTKHVAFASAGYTFPHKAPSRRGTAIRAHPSSAKTPSRSPTASWDRAPPYHQDSGFPTRYLMRRIVEPLLHFIEQRKPHCLLHLGCKNGAILHEYLCRHTDARAFGVDPSPALIEGGKRGMATMGNVTLLCNQIDDRHALLRIGSVDVAFVMLGRLLELTPMRRVELRQWLVQNAARTVVYAFPGWIPSSGVETSQAATDLGLRVFQSNPCFLAELKVNTFGLTSSDDFAESSHVCIDEGRSNA